MSQQELMILVGTVDKGQVWVLLIGPHGSNFFKRYVAPTHSPPTGYYPTFTSNRLRDW